MQNKRKQNWGQEPKALRSRLSFAEREVAVEDHERSSRKWHAATSLHLEKRMSCTCLLTDHFEGEGDTEFSAGLGAVLVDGIWHLKAFSYEPRQEEVQLIWRKNLPTRNPPDDNVVCGLR